MGGRSAPPPADPAAPLQRHVILEPRRPPRHERHGPAPAPGGGGGPEGPRRALRETPGAAPAHGAPPALAEVEGPRRCVGRRAGGLPRGLPQGARLPREPSHAVLPLAAVPDRPDPRYPAPPPPGH